MTSKLDDARDAIVNKVVDLLGVYKTHILGSGSGSTPQLTVSDNLKLLPALTLGLLKHVSPGNPISYELGILGLSVTNFAIGRFAPKLTDTYRSAIKCHESFEDYASAIAYTVHISYLILFAQYAC